MILLDSSQFFIGALMSQSVNGKVEENIVRHILLNSIREKRVKFHKEFGELVFCIDSRHYWRKDVFSHYKSHRKAGRDKSTFDWEAGFKVIEILKAELRETFPYKIIEVHGAESDDIIATLVKNNLQEKNLILSSDKDFIQLQKYPNVFQYDSVRKKWLKDKNPELFLREHIIRGDASDGVPNMLSADDALSNPEKKQKSIFKKNLDVWLKDSEEDFYNSLSNKEQSNYSRNKMMIDLDKIPSEITEKILQAYAEEPLGNRNKILNYMIKNRLRELTKIITDY